MNKQFTLMIVLLIFSYEIHAQCTPLIPSNAVVIKTIDTINGGFDPIWVCPGDSLHTDGGFHNIYLETGSFMSSGGGIDTIFVKSGATLYMNGGIHYIYYENDTDLILAGGIPTLDSCAGISFNYSSALANGCFPGPVASFQSTDSSLCAGTCINFIDMSFHASSWQWSFPGAIPSSDTIQNPQNICYPAAGSFDVTLIISDSIGSDTLTVPGFIIVNPIPVVSGMQNGSILSVTAGFGYQWYEDTTLLAGETNDTLVATQIATYYVLVTDSNGCDTTLSFLYDNTGINDITTQTFRFTIAPNPAKNSFIIRTEKNLKQFASDYSKIELMNTLGKNVLSQNINLNQATEVFLKNISSGVYFVRVTAGDRIYVEKLVVE